MGEKHSEAEVRELLEQNPSFRVLSAVFCASERGQRCADRPRPRWPPDRSIIPPGSPLLAEVPLLDNNGKSNGQYELRLMVALDVGGAIKGQHFRHLIRGWA